MNEFINEHLLPHFGTFISAVLTGLAGFIFGKRKQKAETESIEVNNDTVEIGNADKLVKVYKDTLKRSLRKSQGFMKTKSSSCRMKSPF